MIREGTKIKKGCNALGIGFLVVGLLHLTAWLFMVFVYHATATPEAVRNYLPVYGRLGRAGVWLFIGIVVLDLIAAWMLLPSRRRRTLALFAGLLNVPIVPLGSIIGALAILAVVLTRQERIR